MYIYNPNFVKLPAEFLPRRKIKYTKNYNVLDKSKEDVDTVFYDVFISSLTKKLLFIGPALYNLKRELCPIKVYINGEKIKLRYFQIERLFFLESKPLRSEQLDQPIVHCEFKNFTHTLHLAQDNQSIELCSKIPLTISTLQKDNCIEWISDWILWHRRLLGIKRVILYDNGSSNINQLIEFLPTLEPEVQIVLVHWDFPHGLPPYKSAQHGSLNHCRLRFPVAKGYCINLDLDEYLVNMTDESLTDYLRRSIGYPSPGAVIFKPRIIPNTIPENIDRVPRCFDYQYRLSPQSQEHKDIESGRWFKYAYSYENIGYNAPHKTHSHLNPFYFRRFNPFMILLFFLNKTLWNVRRLFVKSSSQNPKPEIDSITVGESAFFFFHIHGLTSGWRGRHKLKSYSEWEASSIMPEPEIKKLAMSIGLLSQTEKKDF